VDTSLTTKQDHGAVLSLSRLRQNPRTAPTHSAALSTSTSWPHEVFGTHTVGSDRPVIPSHSP
jgi:hypothetical protein